MEKEIIRLLEEINTLKTEIIKYYKLSITEKIVKYFNSDFSVEENEILIIEKLAILNYIKNKEYKQ